MKGITTELGFKEHVVKVYCDSQSATHLSKNNMYHKRTKHIDVCLHFVRDTIAREYVRIEKISTLINPADMLTKVTPLIKFEQALDLLNILQI